MLLRKGVLKTCSKFTEEHSCWSVISINLQCKFIEIIFRHGCPPVKLLHIFRTPFLSNTSGGLLLQGHSNKVQYHVISLISFWASKIIVMCYKSFYRNSWYFFLSEFFCESMVLVKGTLALDRWHCCENYIPGLFAFIQFEIWLNFILIIAKWKLLVQLSSASLSMIRDNSLIHDLFRMTIAMLCCWGVYKFFTLCETSYSEPIFENYQWWAIPKLLSTCNTVQDSF